MELIINLIIKEFIWLKITRPRIYFRKLCEWYHNPALVTYAMLAERIGNLASTWKINSAEHCSNINIDRTVRR